MRLRLSLGLSVSPTLTLTLTLILTLTLTLSLARRSKEAERAERRRVDALPLSDALKEEAAREPDEQEPQEPLGLIVLVVGSLAYSVLGALPGWYPLGGALLG